MFAQMMFLFTDTGRTVSDGYVGHYDAVGYNVKVVIRSFVILRLFKPRSFESKFRKRCTKKVYSALRINTLYV